MKCLWLACVMVLSSAFLHASSLSFDGRRTALEIAGGGERMELVFDGRKRSLSFGELALRAGPFRLGNDRQSGRGLLSREESYSVRWESGPVVLGIGAGSPLTVLPWAAVQGDAWRLTAFARYVPYRSRKRVAGLFRRPSLDEQPWVQGVEGSWELPFASGTLGYAVSSHGLSFGYADAVVEVAGLFGDFRYGDPAWPLQRTVGFRKGPLVAELSCRFGPEPVGWGGRRVVRRTWRVAFDRGRWACACRSDSLNRARVRTTVRCSLRHGRHEWQARVSFHKGAPKSWYCGWDAGKVSVGYGSSGWYVRLAHASGRLDWSVSFARGRRLEFRGSYRF